MSRIKRYYIYRKQYFIVTEGNFHYDNDRNKQKEVLYVKNPVQLKDVYATPELDFYKNRIGALVNQFHEEFSTPKDSISVFSVAGRIEVGGNHTDHQLGKVLCATIHLDTLAVAEKRGDNIVSIQSEGYAPVSISVDDCVARPEEKNTMPALLRGVCHKLKELGYQLGGFDAIVTSNVLKGSGMSSSASFEGLLGVIFNEFYCNNEVSLVELAKIGQYAENVYFGKPSGLMDQIACLLGGFIYIDFYEKENPRIEKIDSTFLSNVYDVCIMDTGDAHDDLTSEYTDITLEIGKIASFFGETHLSRVEEKAFYENLAILKKKFGDRAVLRGIHFFQETKRAEEEYIALKEERLDDFLKLVKESGSSSVENLQNIYACSQPQIQGASILLALCKRFLGEKGAYRIHGGGFGGTVQAFVPKNMTSQFKQDIEAVMGVGSCHVVSIRSQSGTKLDSKEIQSNGT